MHTHIYTPLTFRCGCCRDRFVGTICPQIYVTTDPQATLAHPDCDSRPMMPQNGTVLVRGSHIPARSVLRGLIETCERRKRKLLKKIPKKGTEISLLFRNFINGFIHDNTVAI